MSIVSSKNKEKRRRTSSNETNTSFVKNVTSRVSGLLPYTITKWFSSPTSSNANGSAATAEATDSSTEDDETESPVITQPSAKRMRFTTNKFNRFANTDGNCSTSNIEITEIPGSHFSGSQSTSNRSSLTLTPIRNSNESLINDPNKDKSERDAPRFKSHHSVSSIGQSVAAKRKSIFDKSNEESSKPNNQSASTERKPRFKPSLLGSPFYPGRTMYGGAASSYINLPNIQQQTVALVNEAKHNEDSAMSSSARRIMDLLESYSSPLMEARRIPQYTRPKNNSLNTSADRFVPYSTNRSLTYKTQELHVPGLASILKLKQRSRLMDTTKTARQIIASHSSASSYPLTYPTATSTTATSSTSPTSHTITSLPDEPRQPIEKEQSKKMTTKVKTRVARTNRVNQDELDMATPVKLPAATLQIDQNKLPKFAFDTPTIPRLTATSTPKIAFPPPKVSETRNITEEAISKPDKTNTSVFKFSKPVRISCDTPDIDTTPPKFTFDSPERGIDKHFDQKNVISSVVGDITESVNCTVKPKEWQCPDCWVNNKADVTKCVCCGYKQVGKTTTTPTTKCIVCKLGNSQLQKDKCVTCEKTTTPPSTVKANQSSKWKCDSCWVMNEKSAAKCVCCGVNKPTDGKSGTATETSELFKNKSLSTVGNFATDSKTTKALPTTTFFGSKNKTDDNTFITIAKTQKSDKWECSSCLVRNESDKSMCVCCGAEKETKNKLSNTKFNFGVNNSFKFGIDPKVQESKISKAPEIKLIPESKLKDQSETNNNVLLQSVAETPTFTFKLPTKAKESKSLDTPTSKSEEPAKFNFGIPLSVSATLNEVEPAKVIDEDKENPQEVPHINFSSPIAITPKPAGGLLFTSPLTQLTDKENPSVVPSTLFTADSKIDSPANPITLPTAVMSVEKQAQNTFTLGSPTIKIATNLFAKPTISVSSNLFSSPVHITAVTTHPSTIPLQNTATTSNVAPTPATPMFSFGTNSANNPTPAPTAVSNTINTDQPKFQFTFGSNTPKTDAAPALLNTLNQQSVFASPFGGDNKAKPSFSLIPGNTLGSTNAIPTATNGLGAANGLSGNGLVANPLGGSTLGGSTLGSTTLGGTTLPANPMGGSQPGNALPGNLMGGNNLAGNTFTATTLTPGNGVPSTNTLGVTNGLPGNLHTGANSLQATNALTSGSSNIFGGTVQKENMWNANNNTPTTNMFVTNTTTTSLQKPPTFSFGPSTQFNATHPPAFGANAQPSSNIFGMTNQNNNSPAPSLFANPTNPAQNAIPAPMFGNPQPSNPAPQLGMFGTPTNVPPPAFGSPNTAIAPFESTSMTPAPSPAFNFGVPPPTTGIFGFGQQQPQQQPPQAGVYSFGGPPPGAAMVQFNMGMAPNPAGRRLRKAVRRATPR